MKIYDITVSGTVKVQKLNAEREVLAVCKTQDSWEIVGGTVSSGLGEYTISGRAKDYNNIYIVVSDTISKVFEADLEVFAGEYIRPTVPNGYVYKVVEDGVLSTEEPIWTSETDTVSGLVVLEPELYSRPQVHGPVIVDSYVQANDPYWNNVVSLLHFDGDNDGAVFYDNAQPSRTWNVYGGVVTSIIDKKFGPSSGYFSGNGRLGISYPAAWKTTEPITFEVFINPSSVSSTTGIFGSRYYSGVNRGFQLSVSSLGELAFSNWNNSNATSTTQTPGPSSAKLQAGEWSHVALVHLGSNDWRIFLNGEQVASVSGLVNANVNQFVLGAIRSDEPHAHYTGFMDEFRVTAGVARYTENFTPPTEPFPNT